MRGARWLCAAIAALALVACDRATPPDLASQVVTLFVTHQGWDADRPWAKANPEYREAFAVVVEGRLLLTLAQMIADATLIQVERRDALPEALARRLVLRGEERLLVLVPRGEAAGGGEIVLAQDDVRQIQLAKGAIASGIRMLQHVLGIGDDELTELMLAGGFGNYLSITSAVRIGLIPDLDGGRIRYVGNATALGAQLALVSEPERARAARLARAIEHVALATHPDLQDLFVEAMNFPRPS